jgi:hypothetical protein
MAELSFAEKARRHTSDFLKDALYDRFRELGRLRRENVIMNDKYHENERKIEKYKRQVGVIARELEARRVPWRQGQRFPMAIENEKPIRYKRGPG